MKAHGNAISGISIHSSRVGRYSNTAQNLSLHFFSITKNHLFFLSAAPETLKIPRIHRENNICLGANPPHFLCELPVRTITRFVIHNHLLLSYYITPFESKLVKSLIGFLLLFLQHIEQPCLNFLQRYYCCQQKML